MSKRKPVTLTAVTLRDDTTTMFGSTGRVGRPANPVIGENMKLPGTAFDISVVDTSIRWLSSWMETDLVLLKAGIPRTGLRPLLYDDEICQCLEQRFDALMTRGFSLTCKDDAVAVEKVTKELNRVYRDLAQGLFNALNFGYSVVEIVYRPSNEKRTEDDLDTGLAKAVEVPFEWFDFLHNVLHARYPKLEPADPRKFFYAVRQPTFRNPRGEPLLSRLYWVWYFRTHGWQFWMKALERCGVPFLVGKTVAADKQAAAQSLFAAVQNAVLAIGPDDEVKALEMGKNPEIFKAFDEATISRIQKMILGQPSTSGSKSGEGMKQGEVHERTLERKVSNDAEMITAPIQNVVDCICFLNGLPQCIFTVNPPLYVNAAQATRDVSLKQAGIIVEFSPQYLQRSYGLREGEFIAGDKNTVPVGSTGKSATGPTASTGA